MKMNHSIVAIGLGVTISLLLLLLGFPYLGLLFFMIGILIGVGFFYLDATVLIQWYQMPQPLSLSFLFLLIYFPSTIFMFTSSNSFIGAGVLLAIGLVRFSALFQATLAMRKILKAAQNSHMTQGELNGQGGQASQAIQHQASLDAISKNVLHGGKKPFTYSELQAITIALGLLLWLILVKVLIFV